MAGIKQVKAPAAAFAALAVIEQDNEQGQQGKYLDILVEAVADDRTDVFANIDRCPG